MAKNLRHSLSTVEYRSKDDSLAEGSLRGYRRVLGDCLLSSVEASFLVLSNC